MVSSTPYFISSISFLTGSYDKALSKLKQAEEESDIQTADEGETMKRKRKYSSEDNDEWISNFPLHSLDDVTAAEDKLENDAAARKKLVKKMSMIRGSTLDSTVRRILTFLIGSSLATKFNWLGRGHADKKAFSNLLLKDLIFSKNSEVE
ncbi:hypothetical protein HOLleu_37882 [Holothuria leucospilota]|uniref:DUF4806 domain-containing protein n=1 Tax=Holothuria leucospilota TaxID=206669 RepID=A0A9Q1BDP2_HOLLE|nr:hypothetical protein HOLleu_37882 [Holothuria leucospilota]